ncbi:deoxyribodipyrimidine photo-lyase [Carboxylicivirga mesophila]|uniref:Deoxyribodipyrimidine photo-lyase n=1 Tax=Carboxylicivirga mesophila TaxID=1166478 RepID=A0ABS5KB31_9BACT|nr:deoxyribodipyrimidine photo-lyase [Carboxylicivirga mesophila]MBS2212235.1 deoxyribodipyrimidine photo-lyase [Carboxylicivirga mesophila]
MTDKITIHWFRRDLRLDDNTALNAALNSPYPVLPVFIFDTKIIEELPSDDARISFIYQQLNNINQYLQKRFKSCILIKYGDPLEQWQKLLTEYNIGEVHFNRDYEPYALQRDQAITDLLSKKGIKVSSHKDHVIFEAQEVLKKDGSPYTVYTPYKKQWLSYFNNENCRVTPVNNGNLLEAKTSLPALSSFGFQSSSISIPAWNFDNIPDYAANRDIPYLDHTSHLGPHLRFGTISIRQAIAQSSGSDVFLSELIWREFFMQIMVHFPQVIVHNFKRKYDGIQWQNNQADFQRWCNGQTGYPLVDAGMRQLNQTGFMHNRVRMVCASFLCKHLLIDWRWGESYFAQKLLDYELASNNGNWQWAAGTGCDAAPYFRVFNPTEQQRKFDPEFKYIRRWINEFDSFDYASPMVEHKSARLRALDAYKSALQ